VLILIAAAIGAVGRSVATQEAASPDGTSILSGVFTASQAARGEREFQQACASCHDVSEQSGRQRFAAKWSKATLGDVFDLISTTMPEANPGGLSPEAYASIIAYFLKESGYPEGERDLSTDSSLLKAIRVEPHPK
jgi:hypothetical protein